MTKELKKLGSNIDLKGLVIHQVNKIAGRRGATHKYATKLLTIQDKEKMFIARVYKAYFDQSRPIYGIFEGEHPTFRDYLSDYIDSNDFFEFSKSALDHYKYLVGETVAATGGFVIFAHFENTDKGFDYMLVMTINNKDGFVVSESDLTIKDIKNLDLSKVDVACMINLTKWKAIEEGEDTDSNTYLSFAKGIKEVSYYFMTFIDCNNKSTKTESTNKLTRALDAYCDVMEYDRDTKIRKKNDVFVYCTDCIDNKREIQLSALSAILDPENPESFSTFAADDEYGVSSIINGDKKKLKPLKFVIYKDENMTLEFDSALIGNDIVLNQSKRTLTIKNISDKLIDLVNI